MAQTVSVTVPATTANLGPGFDCIGAALTRYNRFHFTLASTPGDLHIAVQGAEAAKVSSDRSNLLYRAFAHIYKQLGQPIPGVEITIELGVPLSRGLGSSATAIVGGLLAANTLSDRPFSNPEILHQAIALEGHPDNVVPALLGNCQLCVATEDTWKICPIPWHPDIIPVIAIPDFELSTQAARAVLPPQIPRADAIFNVAHLGLLLRALETGRPDWLSIALQDRLHQPYRQTLIPGYPAVEAAAIATGAWGLTISGAGPSLLALASPSQATNVAAAIVQTWQQQGIPAIAQPLTLDPQGAIATAA